MKKFWTPERIAIVRDGYQDGTLAADIAKKIGRGCTRNMVIGKADRLGLVERDPRRAAARRDAHTAKAKLKPTWRRRQVAAQKRLWADPAFREKMRHSNEERKKASAEANA